MKYLASIIGLAVILLATRATQACYPCSYWSTWGDRLAVCTAPSESLLDDELACMRSACADPCASWLSIYDSCAASGDPACAPSGSADCDACIEGIGAYVGIGCATTTQACSADQTGCVSTCSAWLGGGAICDVVTQQEIDLSTCACSGACASKCGSSCMPDAWGGTYYDNGQPLSQQCSACLTAKHGCSVEYLACMGA